MTFLKMPIRNSTCSHVGWRFSPKRQKSFVFRSPTRFLIQIFFIGLRDVRTSCKRDFWVGGRFFTLIGGGFLAENQKNHFFALYGRSKNRSKKARFWPSRSSKLNGWGGCVLCFQVAVHRGANEHFLMNLQVWGKTVAIIFCIFSPVSMCDRTMVPSTTLESFKSGAFVVPGSTGGDLQTHTKTTMSPLRVFGRDGRKLRFRLYVHICQSLISQCARCKKIWSSSIFFKFH